MLHPRYLFFFFNDTATTEIYTLSLHDALPISCGSPEAGRKGGPPATRCRAPGAGLGAPARRADAKPAEQVGRSEEHTSELQSRLHLVCRLLLEKKTYGPDRRLDTGAHSLPEGS